MARILKLNAAGVVRSGCQPTAWMLLIAMVSGAKGTMRVVEIERVQVSKNLQAALARPMQPAGRRRRKSVLRQSEASDANKDQRE